MYMEYLKSTCKDIKKQVSCQGNIKFCDKIKKDKKDKGEGERDSKIAIEIKKVKKKQKEKDKGE